MSTSHVIACARCATPCGRTHDSTYNAVNGFEPGFAEGVGENFILDGSWYCSQKCLDEEKAEREADENEPFGESWVRAKVDENERGFGRKS